MATLSVLKGKKMSCVKISWVNTSKLRVTPSHKEISAFIFH